jgi:DNA-binding XRE family transcriptional regulator
MSDFPRITCKAARVNADMTIDQASKEIGVNRSTLMNYEKGKTVPDWDVVERISDVYNFPAQFILFGKQSVLNGN